MIPDLDIYRSANLLVKRHGEDAPIEAAMRADAVMEVGDSKPQSTLSVTSVVIIANLGDHREVKMISA